jgi:hypothetical protein
MSNDHDPTDTNPRHPAGRVKAQVEAADFKWLMSSEQGRRVASRLVGEAGIFQTSFTGNSETFFREGKRSMGLFLVAQIMDHAPEMFALMLSEARAKPT